MTTTTVVNNPDGSTTTIGVDGGNEIWRSTTIPPTQEQTNSQTIIQRAQNALQTNDNFLAIAAPSNAQTVAQVQRLTKENNAIIRYLFSLLSDVSDTA